MAIDEARVLISADRLGRVAIVQRRDGLFCLYARWRWSAETQKDWGIEPVRDVRWTTGYDPAFYWDLEPDTEIAPLPGIYGSIEEAETEARQLLGLGDGKRAHKIIELDASTWQSPNDFFAALLPRMGAPAWHGRNLNALDDSLYGGINELEPPFTVIVSGTDRVPSKMTDFLRNVAETFAKARLKYNVDVTFHRK